MKLRAVVKYLGALAHYIVKRKKGSIYEAKLIQYEGKPERNPPSEILMVRNVGHWSGDIEDKDLTDKIGYCLEQESRKGDFFEKEGR
jgi:hypothetical protein